MINFQYFDCTDLKRKKYRKMEDYWGLVKSNNAIERIINYLLSAGLGVISQPVHKHSILTSPASSMIEKVGYNLFNFKY